MKKLISTIAVATLFTTGAASAQTGGTFGESVPLGAAGANSVSAPPNAGAGTSGDISAQAATPTQDTGTPVTPGTPDTGAPVTPGAPNTGVGGDMATNAALLALSALAAAAAAVYIAKVRRIA